MTTSELPDQVNVAAIRAGLGGWPVVTQAAFAARFGFSAAAVRDWEQGRRKPGATSRALLLVIAHDPGAVDAALRAAVVASGGPTPTGGSS